MSDGELNFEGGSDALERTDEILSDRFDEPKSLSDYTDHLYDNPSNSGHKQRAHYLLDAIKSQGTREVVEKGEEKERWRFFDDPTKNGKHAIIGNTDMLNSWVNDLEKRVRPDSAGENQIDWFEGATATGKSEFRKNIISGLKAYSRTEEGRIHTIEWAENGAESSRSGFDGGGTTSSSYIDAPGVEEPLNLFPEDVQRTIEQDINNLVDEDIVLGEGSLLPPSKKERERLWEEGREGQEFSEKFDEDYVRIKNVELGEGSEGKGIRTVNAEESDKKVQHLLLGEWMLKWAQEGKPPEREYDGLNAFNFIEEGQQFLSKIPDLKNFIDNNKISGTVDIHMDNYTMILSNEVDLDEVFDRAQNVNQDSIQRRTNKHSFDYLTNFRQETGLLRKELSPKDLDFNPAIADEIEETRKPLKKNIISDGEEIEIEYAPQSLESASMYAVISRLTDDLPTPNNVDQDDALSFIEKAELFESGEITRINDENKEETIDIENLVFENLSEEGKEGIPVTYVRDTLADISYEETGANIEEYDLDLGKVVTPVEIVDLLAKGLDDSALLEKKADDYRGERLHQVRDYALDKMEGDVLDAIFMDITPDQDEAKTYVDHFFAREHDEELISESTGRKIDPDPYTMKEFEIRYLGFDESNYDGADPEEEVEEFRDKLRTSLNRGTWESRNKETDDLHREIKENPLEFSPIKEHISAERDWDDIPDIADGTRYGDFDPAKWTEYLDPLSFEDVDYDTDTENVKYKALSNMVEEMDYSPEAAVKTARTVIDERVI